MARQTTSVAKASATKPKEEPKNTVTKAQTNALAMGSDFEDFAGAGLENVGAGDLLVPRLAILQKLSPQVDPSEGEFIEGAKVGDIADLGTGELFPDGIWFLPVFYRKDYLEWFPRATGKGLANVHASPAILDQCVPDDRNRPTLPNGNYVAETAQFFGVNLSADRRLSFIPMASTQLKKARRWNTLAKGEKLHRSDGTEFTAPFFYRTYHLTTVDEENPEGKWKGWKIERGMALPEIKPEEHGIDWRTLKEEVIAFRDSLVSGAMKADVNSMNPDNVVDGEVVM